MSVLTRLLLIYMAIVLCIAGVGVGIFTYVRGSMEGTLYAGLSDTSSRMSQQLDSLLRPMEYTSMHLLSNRDFYMSMKDLTGLDREDPGNYLFETMSKNEIYSIMMSYSFYKYFYRVSVFNGKWDFFSSRYDTRLEAEFYRKEIEAFPWTDPLLGKDGGVMVLPPYEDPWDRSGQRVFALARAIRGGLGFIEVQQPATSLDEIFALSETGGGVVLAVTGEGGLLYFGGASGESLAHYRSLAADPAAVRALDFEPQRNPVTGVDEVFAAVRSEYSGVTVLLIQNQATLLKPLRDLAVQMVTLYLVVVLLACFFFALLSWQLMKPLRQLKREMEVTHLENLPTTVPIVTTNNEISSLSHAFNNLKGRLNELIQREISLQALHIQASFDALQAQINPHFLYNTLGLISNRAVMREDEETGMICGSIAAMLRYSASTKVRYVTLRDELVYLADYVYLMKARYEHRLAFTSEVDGEIEGVALPKMVLQPLVENALSHAFESAEGIMRVTVAGGVTGDRWRVSVSDNGRGFSEEALATLRGKFARIDVEKGAIPSGELGGLGLVNIYARLRLFSEGTIALTLSNNPDGGALAVLEGSMADASRKGERIGVQGFSGR